MTLVALGSTQHSPPTHQLHTHDRALAMTVSQRGTGLTVLLLDAFILTNMISNFDKYDLEVT